MIKVLFFAQAKDQAGMAGTDWPLSEEPLTVRDVRSRLLEAYGIGARHPVLIAVNEVYADDDQQLRTGDTIAIIPPVSGG